MLTPDQIRNPERQTGFNYVKRTNRKTAKKPFQAQKFGGPATPGSGRGSNLIWCGHYRHTAEEAAQDYCDFVNSTLEATVVPTLPWEEPIIDMGTSQVHVIREEKAVPLPRKDTSWQGPTDLYDIVFYYPHNRKVIVRKIGVTADAARRYLGHCKTFGMSIKPYARPITYSTKAKAEAAERARIAEVEKNSRWKKVGKESFAPVGEMSIDEF